VCYQLIATTNSGPPGLSDVLCGVPRIAAGQRTITFGVQLNQTEITSLFWTIGPAPNAYMIAPLGTSRAQLLRNGTVAVTDDSAGVPTCYTLVSIMGTQPTGLTNVLCAVPGQSTLTGPDSDLSALRTAATMQAAVEYLDRALPR
jgi:hypothetical protein